MLNIKNICLICFFVCFTMAHFLEAVDVTERKIKATDGTTFEVTEVTDDDTNIVILKKDGQIYEQQITQVDQEYVITKVNNTCNVEFLVEKKSTNDTCYAGRTPSEDEITEDIKAECRSLEVRFVNPVNCSSENHVHKRWFCRYYCYYSYRCHLEWFLRWICSLSYNCYIYC